MLFASKRSELKPLTVLGRLSKKEGLWQMPWLKLSRGFPFF
jgi:hypothetical protein